MKKLLLLIISVFFLASCEIYIDEEPRRRDDRNKFIGDYRIEESSNTYNSIIEYSIEISKSRSSNNRVYIHNFYDSGIEIYALVDGDRITIPFQEVYGFEVSGRGYLYNGELELYYDVTDLEKYRLVTDYCDAVAWTY